MAIFYMPDILPKFIKIKVRVIMRRLSMNGFSTSFLHFKRKENRVLLLLIILITSFHYEGAAQPVFVREVASFNDVAWGNSKWADLDNDKDLDLILCGTTNVYTPATYVYENINGTFSLKATALPGVEYGSFATGDYDKDGDLDIIISGSSNSIQNEVISEVYRNDGAFTFTRQFTFPGLSNSTTNWFDIDNDEDLDLILTGLLENNASLYATFVYENNGTAFVELTNTNLPPCNICTVDIADGNGDGFSDILMTNNYLGSNVYYNNRDKTFSADNSTPFKQLGVGSARWGDFDLDGDMDIILTGQDLEYNYHSLIYENVHGNTKQTFIERDDIKLLGLGVNGLYGTLWYDVNNDGQNDLFLTGRSAGAGGFTNRQYINEGEDTFTEILEPGVDLLDNFSLDAGDFDNDGDLDLSFTGFNFFGNYPLSGYLRNSLRSGTSLPNIAPQPPSTSTFKETYFRKEIRFSWGTGSDTETPAKGLTYNFYLRSGTNKIIVPNVNFTNGYLRSSNPPNGFGGRGFANMVPEGTLYYAVQSIDGSKAGSVFSPEKTIYHFNGPESKHAEIIGLDKVKLSWFDNSVVETNYKIERSTSPNSDFSVIGTIPANTTLFTDQFNFTTDTYYYYRINGYNNTHTSPYDSLILLIPTPPTDLMVQAINASLISLSWNDHSNFETGYLIERKLSTETEFDTLAFLPPNTESFDDYGVEACSVYEYRVRAYSVNGALPATQTVSDKTNCYPVTSDFEISGLEDNTLPFSASYFENNFSDEDVSDQLHHVKVETLPGFGVLRLIDVPVTAGQEIAAGDLSKLSFTPEENYNGINSFFVRASDGIDYSLSSWELTINIILVNDPPMFQAIEPITKDEDFSGEQKINLVLVSIPYEVDDVSYTISPATSAISVMSINSEMRTITFKSLLNKFGQEEFTVTADDGNSENNTYNRKFTLTINPVNDPPVLGIINDVKVELTETAPPILIDISDVDSPISASMFKGFATDKKILKDENIVFTKDNSGQIYMQLTPEKALGITNVAITANDGFLTDTKSFNLEVYSVTAVNEWQRNEDVKIYPNPVLEELIVSFPSASQTAIKINILDMVGRNIFSTVSNASDVRMNIADLPRGMYLVNVTLENGLMIQKRIMRK